MPLNYYFVDIAQGSSDGLLLEMNGTGYIPDIALLDIRIPGIGGIELAKVLNRCAPECKIVFISSCILCFAAAQHFLAAAPKGQDIRMPSFVCSP